MNGTQEQESRNPFIADGGYSPESVELMRALSSYRKTAGNSTSTPEQIFGVIVSLGYRREGHQAMSQADAARLFAVAMSNVNGGGKVWRLAGEKCSARFVEGPRGSVVGGSRRGVNEAFRALC